MRIQTVLSEGVHLNSDVLVDEGREDSNTTKRGSSPGRWGDTLIFSYIRRLGSFFGFQSFEFQYFLGYSEKPMILGGMKILWIFFWSHHIFWLY